MNKTVTFVYADGHIMTKKLADSMKGLRHNGKRPVEARLNFSEDEVLSRVELEQLYNGVVLSLHVNGNGVTYE